LDQQKFENLLKQQKVERETITNKLLSSTSTRKIIVSGPGTGKTYTFKELLKTKDGNCLALTFINNLAKKLKDDLGNLAKTCTFHSFCKELLHKIEKNNLSDNFVLLPNLEYIIKSDAEILYDQHPTFSKSFRELDLSNKNIEFFLKRSSYYDAVSFDDSVYRVMEYLKYNPDEIPTYVQIVVDEYQDFNKLEVEFLNILSEKSPILIVGDDDQALYGLLKSASAKYIREKFNDPNYECFCLPFCSRCTLVIIQAIQDIISRAKGKGKLQERIDKQYFCYLPDKWEDSQKYPRIVHAHCSVQSNKAPYIARFIEHEIDKLSSEEINASNKKGDYTVLIAGSGHYLKQVQDYFHKLHKYKLSFRKEEGHAETVKIIDGYKILLEEGESSNLGWRIILELDRLQNIKGIMEKTRNIPSPKLIEILSPTFVNKHINILQILMKLVHDEKITDAEKQKVEVITGMKLEKVKEVLVRKVNDSKVDIVKQENEVSVVFSTYVGCKGLQAGYVFIVGLDEESLPRNNKTPSNVEICEFIVALTRTIKKCYLISTFIFSGKRRNHSIFIDWIESKRLELIKVNKSYFLN